MTVATNPADIRMNSAPTVPRLDRCCSQELLHYFQDAWALEDKLLSSLAEPATFYLRPDPLRNPLIFYLGHSAVFYVNKLVRVGLWSQRLNPDYEQLFEIGVDPNTAAELDAVIGEIQWPEVAAVWDYRDRVKATIEQVIQTVDFELPIHPQHPLWALLMAIEHQRIHIETSSMLLRQLPLDRLRCPADWSIAPTDLPAPQNSMRLIPGGTVTLGKSPTDQTYGWDSEYGRRPVEVPSFWASQFLITNQEYQEFVAAGGYQNAAYWSAEGWQWREMHQVSHPKFWIPQGDHYRYRSTFFECDLPLAWPAEVNYHEAIAFCRWKGEGVRLLSEAEWNRALQWSTTEAQNPAQGHDFQPWNQQTDPHFNRPFIQDLDQDFGQDFGQAFGQNSGPIAELPPNLHWQWISPRAVNSNGAIAQGLADLRGNVWEWIADAFNPLPGFEPHPLYEDQSAPFFDEDHRMMLGGSWATNGSMALPSYRNWFRPHFYQHVGFRIAQGTSDLCH